MEAVLVEVVPVEAEEVQEVAVEVNVDMDNRY